MAADSNRLIEITYVWHDRLYSIPVDFPVATLDEIVRMVMGDPCDDCIGECGHFDCIITLACGHQMTVPVPNDMGMLLADEGLRLLQEDPCCECAV